MLRWRESAFVSLPNGLSLLRIFLTPLFLYCAFYSREFLALSLFFIAAWTDWADGFFARRLGQESRLGQLLDPVADKVLLVGSYLGFYFLGAIPFWLMMIVVFRDCFMLITALMLLLQRSKFQMKPLFISKLNTCLQILYISFVLLKVPQGLLSMTGIIMAGTTIASGLFYMWSLLNYVRILKKPS